MCDIINNHFLENYRYSFHWTMSLKGLLNINYLNRFFQFLLNSYPNSLKAKNKKKQALRQASKERKQKTLIKYTYCAQQLFSEFSISTWGELGINFLVSDWLAVHNTLLLLVNCFAELAPMHCISYYRAYVSTNLWKYWIFKNSVLSIFVSTSDFRLATG